VCAGCEHHALADPEILLINLDAMGDVLRTTALIPAIRRVHPRARITWLTRPNAAVLVQLTPGVDRVLSLGPETDCVLRSLHFDLVLNVDKSLAAGAIALSVNAAERRGFGVNDTGAIVPLNPEAHHLYAMGLDDDLKFHLNQRSAQDLLAEALGFCHARDEYSIQFSRTKADNPKRVGFNTGCAPTWPLKRLSMDLTERAIRRVVALTGESVLLLGGPEDLADHVGLQRALGDKVERSPLDRGLEVGASQVNRCEVVVTGDTLGMHMAIALGVYVVAWFGPTSPQEIELYGRGVKLLADVDCAPCWKPRCNKDLLCNTQVSPDLIAAAVMEGLAENGASGGG